MACTRGAARLRAGGLDNIRPISAFRSQDRRNFFAQPPARGARRECRQLSDTDSFIQEVTEELRRDRLLRLWRRFGPAVIAGLTLIVLAAAVFSWREHRREEAARETGGRLIAAARIDDPARRAEAFAAVAEAAAPGAALLARMSEAGALADAGKPEEAARLLDAIAADAGADPLWRDLAGWKALMLRAPDMKPEALAEAIAPFAAEGATLRPLALEARAVARLRAGDAKGAREDMAAAMSDPRATAELRERLGALAEALPASGEDGA